MTCGTLAWVYLSIPRQQRYGGGRQDRRACPECGRPGRRATIGGKPSDILAEHKETP